MDNYDLIILKIFKRLYTTYVRPHLEYMDTVQTWNPCAKKNGSTLKKVQRKINKISDYSKHLIYDERLQNLNITSLEVRREKGHLIQLYKIETSINKVN